MGGQSGGAIVSYHKGVAGFQDVYAQRVSPAGALLWGAGVGVGTAVGNQTQPRVAYVGSSSIVAWADARDDAGDIYAQRIDIAGNALWAANGVPICVQPGYQILPQVLSMGGDGAVIAWRDNRNGTFDIYAQKVNSLGVPQWTPQGVPVCTAAGDQFVPTLVFAGSGEVILIWEDPRQGGVDLVAQRLSTTGVPLWGVNGAALCIAPGNQSSLAAVPDGLGGAIAAWSDGRNSASTGDDVYAGHMSTSGPLAVEPAAGPAVRPLYAVPNPTRAAARFALELSSRRIVSAAVFDLAGRPVRTLLTRQALDSGTHDVLWDGRTDVGLPARDGVYFVRVNEGAAQRTVRIVLTR
jgi:hypothetical protein